MPWEPSDGKLGKRQLSPFPSCLGTILLGTASLTQQKQLMQNCCRFLGWTTASRSCVHMRTSWIHAVRRRVCSRHAGYTPPYWPTLGTLWYKKRIQYTTCLTVSRGTFYNYIFCFWKWSQQKNLEKSLKTTVDGSKETQLSHQLMANIRWFMKGFISTGATTGFTELSSSINSRWVWAHRSGWESYELSRKKNGPSARKSFGIFGVKDS